MSGAPDVLIIGAPRSGTNMLRDVLTRLPGFTTWPCDEIDPIWRHGNRGHPSDELTASQATPDVRRFVRGRFDRVRAAGSRVVEKTCANSLRVPFVHAVLPDARFLFITRDGLDAAASAMARWGAPVDARYTAAKARFVPMADAPSYAGRFVAGRLGRRRRDAVPAQRTTSWWGPRPHDFRELMQRHPLEEVCAIQWARCVSASRRDLAAVPSGQVHHLSYERFVRDPRAELRAVLAFLGEPASYDPSALDGVSDASIGRGREGLDADTRGRMSAFAAPMLEELGYAAH